jgi:hypothetical protein
MKTQDFAQGSGTRSPAATLQIPTSGYHTLQESAPVASIVAFIHLSSNYAGL